MTPNPDFTVTAGPPVTVTLHEAPDEATREELARMGFRFVGWVYEKERHADHLE